MAAAGPAPGVPREAGPTPPVTLCPPSARGRAGPGPTAAASVASRVGWGRPAARPPSRLPPPPRRTGGLRGRRWFRPGRERRQTVSEFSSGSGSRRCFPPRLLRVRAGLLPPGEGRDPACRPRRSPARRVPWAGPAGSETYGAVRGFAPLQQKKKSCFSALKYESKVVLIFFPPPLLDLCCSKPWFKGHNSQSRSD